MPVEALAQKNKRQDDHKGSINAVNNGRQTGANELQRPEKKSIRKGNAQKPAEEK